jgi:hypothetical protein
LRVVLKNYNKEKELEEILFDIDKIEERERGRERISH